MNYTIEKFEKETDTESYINDYVNVDEFLECCRKCPSYGKIWSCPPFDFNPEDIWKSYDRILIYGYRIKYSDDRTEEEMKSVLYEIKKKVSGELFELEKENPGSISLSAGNCNLCKKCSREEGQHCRMPETMRYSIESLGGDVGKTLSRLCGITLEWIEEGKLPSQFVLCGGLLIKENIE